MKMYVKVFILWALDQPECMTYLNYIKYSTQPAFRPILLSKGIYNYQLATFLGKLLDDVIPNDHSAKDTFSFVEEPKTVNVTNKYMVSYDVTSLFTNMPLEETILLTIDLLFEAELDLNISSKDLQKLQLPQVKLISSLMEACMTNLMGLQWVHLQNLFLPIFSRNIPKRSELGITVMEGYFIIKDVLMIWWYSICWRYVEICCSFGN